MQNTSSTAPQFVDIVGPAIPVTPDYILFAALLITAFMLGVVFIALWRWRRSARYRALQRLKHLQSACRSQQLSTRMASYRIAALLRQRLDIHHVSNDIDLPVPLLPQQTRWNAFLSQLHRLRYAPQACSPQDIDALLVETRYWLKQWP